MMLEQGISINDIEETDYELLLQILSTKKNEKKKEVVPLHEFAKNL